MKNFPKKIQDTLYVGHSKKTRKIRTLFGQEWVTITIKSFPVLEIFYTNKFSLAIN